MLLGRNAECARLDRVLADAKAGRSAVLVLRGAAGAGKTALLEHAAESADGHRVVRAVGVESEMELPFAGLHQLCGALLDDLGRLPPPQRDALGTAFGLSAGAEPDRFLISLAALSLLSDAAEELPLLCLVDVAGGGAAGVVVEGTAVVGVAAPVACGWLVPQAAAARARPRARIVRRCSVISRPR